MRVTNPEGVREEIGDDTTFSDDSRIEGHVAAAKHVYRGKYAIVMDMEIPGIAMGWSMPRVVATDSKAGIGHILQVQFEAARSWIEKGMICSQKEGYLAWVKGHSGVVGNELADYRAKEGAITGKSLNERSIATPAGIKQVFLVNRKRSK